MADYLYFLAPAFAFCLFVVARQYKDYTLGFLSGVVFFVAGLSVFITPMPTLDELVNISLAITYWAVGAYIIFRAAIELIGD